MYPVTKSCRGGCPNQWFLQELLTLAKKVNAHEGTDCNTVTNTARDCYDFYKTGSKKSGIYNPSVGKPLLCDMNGGWTVFQKRLDGSVDFFRNWNNYRRGFGNLNGEFWLGLETLHRITNEKKYMLRIELENFKGERRYAEYDKFIIGDEKQNYKLTLGTYSGNAGDSLSAHNGQAFSTKDKDNDKWSKSCAVLYKGAWWYTACHASNLNGIYHKGKHTSYADGVNWKAWLGYKYSLKSTVMKMRPV